MFKKLLILSLLFSFSTFAKVNVTYDIPGMVCGKCAKTITEYLMKKRDFKKEDIKFNIEKKQVEIVFKDNNPLTKEELRYLLVYAGYELKKVN